MCFAKVNHGVGAGEEQAPARPLWWGEQEVAADRPRDVLAPQVRGTGRGAVLVVQEGVRWPTQPSDEAPAQQL